MVLASVRAVSIVGCALVAFTASAEAQPHAAAPITYATQTMASLEPGLAGGADTSYGYGAHASPSSAPMDVRRTASSTPVSASDAAEQGRRPAWLEQERVGAPYQVNGRWYVPAAEPGYNMVGQASWYGPTFHGQSTASGETYDQEAMTAAHPTLPLNSLVQVTNLENGREVILRVNDRGPFVGDRLIDVSHKAAEVLGFDRQGQARVNVRYLGPAPRHVTDGVAAQERAAPAPSAAPVVTQVAAGPTSLLPSASSRTQEQAEAGAPVEFAPIAQTATVTPVSYTVPSGDYYVQVGAFSNPANAQHVEASVRAAGQVQIAAQGQLYRVRIGPFPDRQAAASAQRTLAEMGYADTILAAR
ncbi:MAG: septal ring lytic transglycosylase RlpA family protein [Pseudomonadota bacterium]